jgi:hypothetical protein
MPLFKKRAATSADLATQISDETGTGKVVFDTTPTLVTPILGVATGTRLGLGEATASVVPLVITPASGSNGEVITSAKGADLDPDSMQLIVRDSTALAANVGGGIGFLGKFTSGGSYAGMASISLRKENATDSNFQGNLIFATRNGGSVSERARITYDGNLKIGGTAARGTTEPTNSISLFNGTAPVGTLTNGVSLYSASGELRSMDAAGNSTLLSPHDHETNEWIYYSKNTVTGKVLRVDMERLMKALDARLGGGFIKEYVEAIN